MSMFNLDRFRFEKKAAIKGQNSGSTSPESEKENKPGNQKLHVNELAPDVIDMLSLAAVKEHGYHPFALFIC